MKKIFLILLLFFSVASAQNTLVRRAELGDSITAAKGYMNDSLDFAIRTYAVNLYNYIGSVDTSVSWTSVFQSAINSVVGTGKILYVPGDYKYTLTNAGNNPYAGSHDYCLDLKTGGYTIQGGQGAILYLKDGQQTDASGALDIVVGKTMSNFEMNGLTIIGNTAGQTGWTGGYQQIVNGCMIRVYGTSGSYTVNKNLVFENLSLYDHWSNPIDVSSADGLIYQNCRTWGVGEGFEAIECRNVLFNNLNVNDSTDVFLGDGIELSVCINFTVTNCTVKENGNGAAFDLYASSNGELKDFYIENWTNGITAASNASGTIADNILVKGGIIKNILGNALESADGYITYENILIDSAGLSGFQIVVSDSTRLATQIIKDCVFKKAASSYVVGNRALILDNCTFDSSWGNAVTISRSFNDAEPEVYITNCTFKNSSYYGIVEAWGGTDSSFSPKGMVSNNIFDDNALGDISVWDSTRITYSNNRTEDELHITSNPAVTQGINIKAYTTTAFTLWDITRGSKGQTIDIRFESSVTVADNDDYGSGSINLSNNTNQAFESGDYLSLQYNPTTNTWDEISRTINTTSIGAAIYEEDKFFGHNPEGAIRNFNPYLENYLYSAPMRFTVSDTGFASITQKNLFDAKYETFATISAGDTGKIYIDLNSKSEMDSLAYPKGYFLVHFFGSTAPASISGDVYYWNGWSAMTSVTNIANNATDTLFSLTVPATNYAHNFRIFIVAGVSDVGVSEIEYYPNGTEETVNSSPLVNKFGANSLYHKLSFKNFNNTEKAYVDSNGNAYFQDLTVANTITVTDSVVTQSYTTDTLTVNNISNLAAATATTLTVGTITSTNGRIQPATGGQIELDSLRNRVAMLDTLVFAFGIADAADGSYSTAIFIPNAITVNKVMAVLRTSTTSNDSAYVNIYSGSSIYSGASTVWTSDKNLSDTTTGHSYTSFDDATIPTNSWMWLQCNNEVETVNQINVTVFAKKD